MQAAACTTAAPRPMPPPRKRSWTRRSTQMTEELNRLAEGDDAFLHPAELAGSGVSAKRLEQVTRQKDAELAYSQIAALEQRAQGRRCPPHLAGREPCRPGRPQRSLPRRDRRPSARPRPRARPPSPRRKPAIREATQERLDLPAEARRKRWPRPAPPPTAARRWAGRWPALPSGRPLPRPSTTRPLAKLWDEYQLTVSQAEEVCAWSSTA